MTDYERSYYRILGVASTASAVDIRAAYLNLARALHPDQFLAATSAEQALAERRMREINLAYEILNDPAERAEYDRTFHARTPSSAQ